MAVCGLSIDTSRWWLLKLERSEIAPALQPPADIYLGLVQEFIRQVLENNSEHGILNGIPQLDLYA